MNVPFGSYSMMVELLKLNGAKMGLHHHDESAARRIKTLVETPSNSLVESVPFQHFLFFSSTIIISYRFRDKFPNGRCDFVDNLEDSLDVNADGDANKNTDD